MKSIDINNQDQGVVESLRKEMNTQMSEEKLNMVKFFLFLFQTFTPIFTVD